MDVRVAAETEVWRHSLAWIHMTLFTVVLTNVSVRKIVSTFAIESADPVFRGHGFP